MNNKDQLIKQYEQDWQNSPRWKGIKRPYTAEEVVNLKGSLTIENTLAKLGAEKFWDLLQGNSPVSALGALTGNQAIQEVQAGMKAIY